MCVREYQNSISDSVHRLLCDQIERLNLGLWFDVTQTSIRCPYNGTEFLFKGMRQNAMEVKSTEGITRCWYEEAQKASQESLDILIPTIRAPDSELWFSYNPMEEDDPVDKIFVKNTPPDCDIEHVTFRDNPYFPEVLRKEMEHLKATDPVAYEHVWEGGYLRIGEAVIFVKRVSVEDFPEPPYGTRFYYGADWGFANDPTALIRFWIDKEVLYIDYEAFGHGVELDETAQLFDSVPEARKWPIKADCARPETISYVRRQGFNITAAEKWKGSVEDGIAHLKAYKKIVIHPRCVNMQREARLYSYKVDRVTKEILPIVVDANNHGWDAVRYGLDGVIQRRGGVHQWANLNK